MLRNPLAVTALLLGLAVAPALAQPAAPGQPEDSTAARTMSQNRKVVIGQPRPATAQAPERAAAKRPGPSPAGRPVSLAEGSAESAR